MSTNDARTTWEAAAPGWAKWEPAIAKWMDPATDAMIRMAGINAGARVLDVASGAGGQTLRAARAVGPTGRVLATDIAESMLRHVEENARAGGYGHVETKLGAAEDLDLEPDSFDAAICQLGLMLFADPVRALRSIHRALRPGGRAAGVVFTSPAANPCLVEPMAILLRHTGKQPPGPGKPGLFALGGPGVLCGMFEKAGLRAVEQQTIAVPLRVTSASEALVMMQEAFGALRAVVSDASDAVRAAAWQEVSELLARREQADGFVAHGEVLVVSGAK